MYNGKLFDQKIDEMAGHLGIDPVDMYDLVIDNARAWLLAWTGGNEDTARLWEATPEFWAWWRSLWLDTDLMHLDRMSKLDLLEIRRHGDGMAQYRRWHDPGLIEARPNSVIYESFHRLVKRMGTAYRELAASIL
jgi:hypothetical protein